MLLFTVGTLSTILNLSFQQPIEYKYILQSPLSFSIFYLPNCLSFSPFDTYQGEREGELKGHSIGRAIISNLNEGTI